MRKVASLLRQKNDFMWPGESNAACMAGGLYFTFQTVNKFLLPFLRGCCYNGKARIFGWIPEMQDFRKEFCSSNHLWFSFSSFSPSTPLMHLCIFRPSPRFILELHSLQALLCAADPLLPCPKGLLLQKMLYGTSPIGPISGLSRKILLILGSLGPFDWHS